MSETVLTLEDATARLPEVVELLSAGGNSAVITKLGRPLARIIPIEPASRSSESLEAFLRRWREQFADADDGFLEAIEVSRRSVRPPVDPWE